MAFYSSVDTCMTDLGVRLGITYTDEQRVFMSDFTVPTISFSSPGTGKTKSAIGGLIIAETFHGIPGNNIYATSFTNMSTGELRHRHQQDCARLGMTQTVHFNTLHSLCLSILKANYQLLGMRNWSSGDVVSVAQLGEMMENISQAYGFTLQPRQIRPIIEACRSLNSQLVFDPEHVQDSYAFKKCGIEYESFKILRRCLYQFAKNVECISKDDIMLYTLELLIEHPEVSQDFKKKCRILLVDEFQDLSLLELRVVSLLSDTVIAIGDIKQQIFAFQGACPDIVDEYKKYYPNARIANLNKSFRCAERIVDFSKTIIADNKMDEQDFVSLGGREGTVTVKPHLSLATLCDSIEQDYRANRNTFERDILFLFRNNFSAIPIAEELFKRKVPFRVNKYKAASTIPVIREMISIVELAANPQDPKNLRALPFILAEMKDYRDYNQMPIYKIMCKEGCSFFEVDYNYRNAMQARQVNELLLKIRDMLDTARPMREILNAIWPLFEQVYLRKREPYLDMPSRYYMNMVSSLVQTKTYFQFVQDEVAKVQAIQDSIARGIGIRCYTFHAAKGLEADDVYMLDCDRGICPNDRQLDIMEAQGCSLEKARDIRNERSLLFVAATRAKDNLTIAYNGEISPLLQSYNMYQQYDALYRDYRRPYHDAESFVDFIHYMPKPAGG